MIKNTSLIILFLFYTLAGVNHFINPASYYRIIPHYIPYAHAVNSVAGGFEILLAILLLIPKTRQLAAWGIIALLIAFLPVHITMIGDAPLKLGDLLVTPLIAWVRLVILQPLLVLWAWWYTKPDNYAEETAPAK